MSPQPEPYVEPIYRRLMAQNQALAAQAHAEFPPVPNPCPPRVAPASELAKAGVRTVMENIYQKLCEDDLLDALRVERARDRRWAGLPDERAVPNDNIIPIPAIAQPAHDHPASPVRANTPPPAPIDLDPHAPFNPEGIREPSPEPVAPVREDDLEPSPEPVGPVRETSPARKDPTRKASAEIVEVPENSAQLVDGRRERSIEIIDLNSESSVQVVNSSREPSVEFVGYVTADPPPIVHSLKRSREEFEADNVSAGLRDRGARGSAGRPSKVRRIG